jgi:hypothetical protein
VVRRVVARVGRGLGDLHVPGRAGRPLETTIVAVDGLLVTLSVAEDIGDYVPRATLLSDLTHLLRTLIQRVEGFAERDNPAGDRLLGEVAAAGELPEWRVEGLNDKQAEAVASAKMPVKRPAIPAPADMDISSEEIAARLEHGGVQVEHGALQHVPDLSQ